MSDNKVTLDQLDSSAVEAMSSSVGDVSMLNTENKTIVGALVEIVGKKEIANAIGEPLAETDKFTEMSSEINGLLSTFKTNMMNAGVVVESGDKFKALIDKIKGLSEGEGNKGIQFASGNMIYDDYQFEITNLSFKPSIIIIINNDYYSWYDATVDDENYVVYTNGEVITYGINDSTFDTYISDTGFSMHVPLGNDYSYWYAIGVGEEDTTLRDSLASILTDEGVSVTEEDDMASLITKVDEEFDRKNNITPTNTYSITSYQNPTPTQPEGYSIFCSTIRQVSTSTFEKYESPIVPGTGTYYVFVASTYTYNLKMNFVRSDGVIVATTTIQSNGSTVVSIDMVAGTSFTIEKVSGDGAITYVNSYYIMTILS